MKPKLVTLIKQWESASLAYMRDCNVRSLKKEDAKRKRLRIKNQNTFNSMTEEMRKQYKHK